MRPSAAIGSEKMTRSTRVLAGELEDIVHRAEIGNAIAGGEAAVVVAIVEHADDADVGIALRGERFEQGLGVQIGADHDGATVKPSLPRPAPHQEEQAAPECDQRQQAEHVECAEPGARELVAGLGEERQADRDQKDHGPGRSEPHILLLVAAERLHLIDVGDLERQHRHDRDTDNGADVIPGKAVSRHHVPEIDRKADRDDQGGFDQPHRAGQHDRRIGRFELLGGNFERRGRERVRAGGFRRDARH